MKPDSSGDMELVARSPLFDSEWYKNRYRDVRLLGMDAAEHYVLIGAEMGRAPGPCFDGKRYLAENPDVAESGLNPLLHFIKRGDAEGRIIHPVERARITDPKEYLQTIAAQRQARVRRRLAAFDTEAAQEFIDCLEQVTFLCNSDRAKTFVSVVMPVRNREQQISSAIESVLQQTHQNFELIVIDDLSVDGTADAIRSYCGDSRLRLLEGPGKGVSAARNTGLAASRGEWIFYLDSDNTWLPDFIHRMLVYLQETRRSCGYSGVQLENSEGEILGYLGEPFDWEQCLESNYVDLNSFCHLRSMYDSFGGFDERLRRMVDWDLILRYGRHCQPAYAPFIGCRYRDSAQDTARVSFVEPIAYRNVVHAKHGAQATTPGEIAAALRMKFSIRTAAPSGMKEQWGDYHFAGSLKAALERLGHDVVVLCVDEVESTPSEVSISIRGLSSHPLVPGSLNILWNISHPDQVPYSEYSAYDLTYVASASYAELLATIVASPVKALLQCTDVDKFKFNSEARPEGRPLFVGNSRGVLRPMVCWALETGLDLEIHGNGWEPFLPAEMISSGGIPNHELGNHYAAACCVLNDHWESMREFGFISNRIFDVLAAGGRVVSDSVPFISRMAKSTIYEVESKSELFTTVAALEAQPDDANARHAASRTVSLSHSFDARARWICNDLLERLGLPRIYIEEDDGLRLEAPRPKVVVIQGRCEGWEGQAYYERVVAPLTTDSAQVYFSTRVSSVEALPAAGIAVCVIQVGSIEPDSVDSLLSRLEDCACALVVDVDASGLFGGLGADMRANERLLARADMIVFSSPAMEQTCAQRHGRSMIAGTRRDARFWRNYRPPTRVAGPVFELLHLGTPDDETFASVLPMLDRLAEQYFGRFRISVVDFQRDHTCSVSRDWLRHLVPPRGLPYPMLVRWLSATGPYDAGLSLVRTGEAWVLEAEQQRMADLAALGLPVLRDGPAGNLGITLSAILEGHSGLDEILIAPDAAYSSDQILPDLADAVREWLSSSQ